MKAKKVVVRKNTRWKGKATKGGESKVRNSKRGEVKMSCTGEPRGRYIFPGVAAIPERGEDTRCPTVAGRGTKLGRAADNNKVKNIKAQRKKSSLHDVKRGGQGTYKTSRSGVALEGPCMRWKMVDGESLFASAWVSTERTYHGIAVQDGMDFSTTRSRRTLSLCLDTTRKEGMQHLCRGDMFAEEPEDCTCEGDQDDWDSSVSPPR
mgnify:CR=1 FL=1